MSLENIQNIKMEDYFFIEEGMVFPLFVNGVSLERDGFLDLAECIQVILKMGLELPSEEGRDFLKCFKVMDEGRVFYKFERDKCLLNVGLFSLNSYVLEKHSAKYGKKKTNRLQATPKARR